MSSALLLLIILPAWAEQPTQATQSEWSISPSTCVVDKPGDSCRLKFTFRARKHMSKSSVASNNEHSSNEPSHDHSICIHVDDTTLRCWEKPPAVASLEVELNHNSELTITNAAQNVLYQRSLEVKSIQPLRQRRRVRSPWSMF